MCVTKGIKMWGDFMVSLSCKDKNIFNVSCIYFDHGTVYSICTYGTQDIFMFLLSFGSVMYTTDCKQTEKQL